MESPPEVTFFTLNGTWLGLYGRGSLAEDAGLPSIGSGFPGFTFSHNVASETDIDHIVEKAASIAAELVKPPQKASLGGYHGYFKDPDGYLWEIACNPHFWVGTVDKSS
jgi:uncharacterized glyoxalase superfamily protein PhnB